jgi:tRNA splicing endonuclease
MTLSLENKPAETVVTVEVLEAFLSRGRVYLPESARTTELRERAFGTLLDEKTKKARNLHELVTQLSVGKPAIWTKYLVYRDLRDRGYLVREGESDYDFETFGKGAMRRLVSIVFEGGESTLEKLARLSAKANKDSKDLVLAVIDRRTDIVYYTLNTENFQGH